MSIQNFMTIDSTKIASRASNAIFFVIARVIFFVNPIEFKYLIL